jgi:hypothetical protein
VEHIADLMTSMQFVAGRTARELAREWGLNPHVVDRDCAEASRYVRRAVDRDPDEMRAQLVSQLQFLTRSAMARSQERTAVEALKATATLLGLEAPKKIEVGGTIADLMPLAFCNDQESNRRGHADEPEAPDQSDDGQPA